MTRGKLEGQLVFSGTPFSGMPSSPYSVVVDGHTLTWEEFGMTLEAFEGFHFKLVVFEGDD